MTPCKIPVCKESGNWLQTGIVQGVGPVPGAHRKYFQAAQDVEDASMSRRKYFAQASQDSAAVRRTTCRRPKVQSEIDGSEKYFHVQVLTCYPLKEGRSMTTHNWMYFRCVGAPESAVAGGLQSTAGPVAGQWPSLKRMHDGRFAPAAPQHFLGLILPSESCYGWFR